MSTTETTPQELLSADAADRLHAIASILGPATSCPASMVAYVIALGAEDDVVREEWQRFAQREPAVASRVLQALEER